MHCILYFFLVNRLKHFSADFTVLKASISRLAFILLSIIYNYLYPYSFYIHNIQCLLLVLYLGPTLCKVLFYFLKLSFNSVYVVTRIKLMIAR